MTAKVLTNEKGQAIVKLPVDGREVTLRSPKGKDLKALEVASKKEDATNTGIMMILIAQLAVSPELTVEDVEDLDAEDIMALGVALSSFRGLTQFK